MEDLVFKYIGNAGVPAIMCFYFMFSMNKTLKELTEAIKGMKDYSDQLNRIENNGKLAYELLRDIQHWGRKDNEGQH